LPEEEKFSVMAGAAALIMPSSLESFSIATLEAFGVGTPVIANASSHVVRGHCIRSNAGLYYDSYEEFAACLSLILTQPELRNRLGLNGQAYIQANYSWEIVESRYVAFLRSLLASL
jgi:glycosyltransferase involved in cell wall biosynthesis